MNAISPIIIEVNKNIIKLINSNNPLFNDKKVYLKELVRKHLQFIKNNSSITYKTLEEIEDIKQYRTKCRRRRLWASPYIHTSKAIMEDETYIKVYTKMCNVKVDIMCFIHTGL